MLRAMIVDDEELAVERLEMVLSEIGGIEICHTSLDPWEAYEYAKKSPPDMAFLDISMPEINGMRLSSLLRELDASIDVVFVTGYDNYAVQAFDVNALDYLLKPVTVKRMIQTLDKVRKKQQVTATAPPAIKPGNLAGHGEKQPPGMTPVERERNAEVDISAIPSTKLHVPHVRKALVSRPRLIRKLNEGMETKLTLLSAQAGYGKTTALSEWVRQNGALTAWVSLDKRDNEYTQFWSCLTAAIQEQVPGFGQTVTHALEKEALVYLEHTTPALLNELNQLTGELAIVIDDYHFIELPDIHRSLYELLERLPSHIHVYIASRTELAIPTSRLLGKGECNQIFAHDLRFQLDEGIVFFRDTADLLLTNEQVTALFDQTEGWISGLQLAAISLKRSENITETIQRFSGRQRDISDYLLREVLRYQSEATLAFLLQTSVLNRMNDSLCEAVTGQTNGQEQLERLEKLNLFIIPLDDHRNWYRYHHLLSDFLQQLLFKKDRREWLQAHHRAAIWLENHGFDEEAVEHYLEGEQFADAVRIIEKNLHTLVQSKSVALHRWVSKLPENAFADKPMIEMFYISVLLGVGEWEAAFRRVGQATVRFQGMRERWGDTAWNRAMGNIYFFCSITSYLQKDLARTSEYFELVERHMPEGSFFQTMGRNRYQGYDAFDDHLAFINDLHAGGAFLSKWIAVWEQKENYPFVGLLYASYSKLLYEWNRLEEADRYVSQAIGRQDIKPFARILIHNMISASRIQQALGNPGRASELLEQLKAQIDSPDNELFMRSIEAEEACLSLRQGSRSYAQEWLQRCGLSHTDEVSLYRVQEHLALARVLAACERMEDALYLLERLNPLLSKEGRLRDRIKALILQSVILHRLGRTEAALAQLEIALQLSEPEGYIRSFMDEGAGMEALLAGYLKQQQGSGLKNPRPVSLAYVKQLLQALRVTPDAEQQPHNLTVQELKIMQLISQGLSNKEIALRLNITSETVKSHIKNVYKKLEVNNRVQALQRAAEWITLG
ncbi:response regulator [Paenibacillus thalictri]|nr:response regulator [Paenibacillus thalictri]